MSLRNTATFSLTFFIMALYLFADQFFGMMSVLSSMPFLCDLGSVGSS